MSLDLTVLLATTASVAFLHVLLGPDHYVPFIALARARRWSMKRAASITLLCGLGHVLGSIVLGGVGIALGTAVGTLEAAEATRGSIAAWALIAFGLVYLLWGLRRAWKNRPHTHVHRHPGGLSHAHSHGHIDDHAHPHDEAAHRSVTPWVLFIVFVLGPCEPLIPLLMYPAATGAWLSTVLVGAVFTVITLATMLAAVLLGLRGLRFVRIAPLERWAHALAGAAVLISGLAIEVLGL